jgi:hypothetical protein
VSAETVQQAPEERWWITHREWGGRGTIDKVSGPECAESREVVPAERARLLDELDAAFTTSDGSDDPLRASAQAAVNAWRAAEGTEAQS